MQESMEVDKKDIILFACHYFNNSCIHNSFIFTNISGFQISSVTHRDTWKRYVIVYGLGAILHPQPND